MAKTYTITGIDAEEVISNLSGQFDLEFEKDGKDFCFDVPKSFGIGHFRTVQFSHGIHVMEIDIKPKLDFELEFQKQDINLLHFFYNSISTCEHTTSSTSESDKIGKLQCSIFSNGIENEHSVKFFKKEAISIYCIVINRKIFEEKIDHIVENIPEDLEKFFRDVNGVNSIYHKSFFSLETSGLIEEFRHCDHDDLVRTVFLEAKTKEILTYQLQSYNNTKNGKEKDIFLRQTTIDKIERAVEIIKDEMDVGINVHTLAKKVGLNQNTLQSGFKNLFNSSVNAYVQNHRMDYAKELIETSDLNITEITYKIGINSRSYFSKLFKERFGVTPSTYLSRKRKKKEKSA